MPDVTNLIQGAFDLASGITQAELKHDKAELITETADLIVENQNLREQIKALRDAKENPLVFNEGLYYSSEDVDSQFPYCPACYEASQQRIHLVKHSLKCPRCGADYTEPTGPFCMTAVARQAGDVLKGY